MGGTLLPYLGLCSSLSELFGHQFFLIKNFGLKFQNLVLFGPALHLESIQKGGALFDFAMKPLSIFEIL